VSELPVDDITRFIGRYSIGRDANPLTTMGSLHFLRIKVPGGYITSSQLRGVAEVAEKYGRSQGEITDRQDIQLHWINAEDTLEIFPEMEKLGFTTDMCGQGFGGPRYGDVRNVVSCPAAGIEREELIDVRPLLNRISDFFIGNQEFHDLPRKFKFSISACRSDCTRAVINDLAFVAVEKGGEVGFTLLAGGSMGMSLPGPRLAKPLGIFVRPEEAFDVALATVEIHKEYGSRESKPKARFKYLIDTWDVEKLRKVLEEKLGRSLDKYEGPVFLRNDAHAGVQPQKRDDYYYVNVPTLGGRLSSKDMALFADLADEYGNGDLRLTPRQNIIIANIKDKETLLKKLEGAGFPLKGSGLRWNSVGCASDFCGKTVSPHCKEMLKETVSHLENHFDQRLLNESRIQVHVSGCPNNCCAKEIATIGLSGLLARENGETRQSYDILLGGEFGPTTTMGRLVEARVPADEVPKKIEALLVSYLAKRRGSERLGEFCNRHTVEELRAYLKTKEG
jgi:sulfite reductase beta subunit-like hemoprotein